MPRRAEARGGAGTETSHAAPLSLEMSYAQDRILVNCGPNLVHGDKRHLASRGVARLAAHVLRAWRAERERRGGLLCLVATDECEGRPYAERAAAQRLQQEIARLRRRLRREWVGSGAERASAISGGRGAPAVPG